MIDDYFLMSSALKKVRATLASHTRLCQLGASRTGFYSSSHTRLCQLADFPSLILRSSFAEPSLKEQVGGGKNCE